MLDLKNFKTLGIAGGILVVLLASSFFVGRYTTQATVVVQEKIKIQEVEKQVVVVQKEVEVKVVKVVEKVTDAAKTTVVQTKPDGTSTTTITENTHSDTHTNTNTDATGKDTVVASKESAKTSEQSKVTQTSSQPNWAVGVQGGYSLQDAGKSYVPGLPTRTVLGVTVEKRLAGPFFVGLWANNYAMLGASLRVTF